MASRPCHAGGISSRIACSASSPPIISTSSMLSRLCESEPLERDQRLHRSKLGQQRRAEQRTACHRPIAVALHGVDLAVVREVAIRMGQPPARQRVGREALVEHGHGGLEPRIQQIGIELGEMLRHHHALEDDGAGRKTRHVEVRVRAPRAPSPRSRRAMNSRRLNAASSSSGRRAVHEHLLDAAAASSAPGRRRRAGRWAGRASRPAHSPWRWSCAAELVARAMRQCRVAAEKHQSRGVRGRRA